MNTPRQHASQVYREAIPGFVPDALERLYAHPFATLGYQQVLGDHASLHTYVGTDGSEVDTVLLFRIIGRRAVVINEFVRLDERQLRLFAAAVFAEFPQLCAISLCAVHSDAELLGTPHQRHLDRADIVAMLPDSAEAYLASLHRNTRSTIRARLNKLQREHPDFSCELVCGAQIEAEAVRTLLDFNRARMRMVGKHSYNDVAMERTYLRLRYECNATLLQVRVDGRLCAGSFNLMAGNGCFGMLNAFDPAYAKYSLGTLAAYLNVCEAIRLGARRFHFGWEPYEYKTHLLGEPHPSWRYELYRSHRHMAAMAPHAVRVALEDRVQGIKRWLQAPQRRDSHTTRLALAAVHRVRDLRAHLRRGMES